MFDFDSAHEAASSPGNVLDPVADRNWHASNRLLSDWIAGQRQRLNDAILSARSIRDRLAVLFPVMADLCRDTCPWCPDPCCIVTRVWFDFRDVLFFHLTSGILPPGPVRCKEGEACRYLTCRGCALPRLQRPWACTQYVCTTQRRCLVKTGGARALEKLEAEIQRIAAARIVMEESVVRIAVR